jgi:hypothetical protein
MFIEENGDNQVIPTTSAVRIGLHLVVTLHKISLVKKAIAIAYPRRIAGVA